MEVSGILETLARVEELLRLLAGGAAIAPQVPAPTPQGAVAQAGFPVALALAEEVIAQAAPTPQAAPPGLGPSDEGWVARLPAEGRRWAPAIAEAARRHGLDPRLLAALVWVESSFRPDAVSPAGAVGLTQLMPATAAGLGVDPRDPLENLEGGARYLAAQIRRFGSVELGLAAYQAGPAAVAAAGGMPSASTRAYVERVLDRLETLGGTTAPAPAVAARPALERPTASPRPELVASPDGPSSAPVRVAGSAGEPRAELLTEAVGGRDAPVRISAPDRAPAPERTPGPDAVSARDRAPAPTPAPDPASAPAPAPHRAAAPTLGGEGERIAPRAAAARIVEAVERLRDATPPRRMAVELPELGGLRVLVEARGTTIHVRPLGGDPVWFEVLVHDLGPGLAARGFDLAGSTGGDPREAPEPQPARRTRAARPRSREGVRI